MSGICGMLALGNAAPDEQVLLRMMGQIAHRGPDGHGYKVEGRCALGAVRLAATDINDHVEQPLRVSFAPTDIPTRSGPPPHTEAWIVHDGEVYNYDEVRKPLSAMNHRFQTHSDTETLLRSYLQFGSNNFVKPYRGKFALAIWDVTNQRLVLLRDRLGEKPLYYAINNDWLVFGSEIKAVLAHPSVQNRPYYSTIPYFLTLGYPPPPHTMYEGVKALPPGHMLIVDFQHGQTIEVNTYWEAPEAKRALEDGRDEDNIAHDLLAHLRWVIRMQLETDKALGILLEGGLNSAALLALIAEHDSSRAVHTFSLDALNTLEDKRVINKMRARFATQHTSIKLDLDLPQLIDDLIFLYDGPFGDPAAAVGYAASRQIVDHDIPVLLLGNGGDELFAGYEGFRIASLAQQYDRFPDLAQRAIETVVDRLPTGSTQQGFVRRLSQVTQTVDRPLAERYLYWVSLVPELWLAALLSPQAVEDVHQHIAPYFKGAGEDKNVIPILLDVTIRTRLPYSMLSRLDRASAGAGLESRTPFLDHQLLKYAADIPPIYKLRRGTSLYILRQALTDLLPRRVLESRSETGLTLPVDRWFRTGLGGYAESVFTQSHGVFDHQVALAMLDSHRSGEANLGRALWPLLTLSRWITTHF